jgi:hypothetical protein
MKKSVRVLDVMFSIVATLERVEAGKAWGSSRIDALLRQECLCLRRWAGASSHRWSSCGASRLRNASRSGLRLP